MTDHDASAERDNQQASPDAKARLSLVLSWSASLLGPCQPISDDARLHGRSTVLKLRTGQGHCYLKVHAEADSWGTEVHGYEQWAPVFGARAPKLLGVRDMPPYALLISELPGTLMLEAALSDAQQLAIWREAGRALAALHARPAGAFFGPCDRQGAPLGPRMIGPVAYMRAELSRWIEPGRQAGWLLADELRLAEAALSLSAAFEGERPVACHRDYNPYNWMVTDDGQWAGVIDFEFAYPELRAIEFARYPDWEYLHQPERVEALLAGYGRQWTPAEEQQRLVAHILYAVAAVVWGQQNAFLGFSREGHEALARLAERV